MSIEFKDNSAQVKAALAKAKHRGLVAIGMTAEAHAKEGPNMPIDTGLARNSITYAIAGEEAAVKTYSSDDGERTGEYSGSAEGKKDSAVYIGSNVEYFPDIELGSPTINACHVLQRAATEHSDEYKRLMKESLENA